MSQPDIDGASDLLTLTAKIVSAHVGGNKLHAEALPGLIQSVYGSLAKAGARLCCMDR